ncbi:MAG: UvrD-helicase domain-containing protein, partial [Calditrichia bacterium]
MQLTPQQMLALDLKRNFAITAGAGSGKTRVLVNRYLHILLHRPELNISNVLAITFTEKAAAEMKERIYEEVGGRFEQEAEHRERLFSILNELHQARIFTIHGFCSQVLRRYPVEAGVSAEFEIADDVQLSEFLSDAFRDFFSGYTIPESEEGQWQLTALREFPLSKIQILLKNAYHQRARLLPFLQEIPPQKEMLVSHWENIFQEYHNALLYPLLS